uniref:Glycosyl transferase, family 2 n=1 Tax=Rhodopseudomonas palustris (strain BisA53) TaxID=316055 RepID=Q07TN9_RHOP5
MTWRQVTGVDRRLRVGASPHRRGAGCDATPELDCLRQVLAPGLLRAAQQRAAELEIGADQVLIRWGVIDEASYLQRLASHLALGTESFAAIDRADTPLRDDQMHFAAATGLVPLRQNGELKWALAPRRLAARNLCRLVKAYPAVRPRTRIATSESLQQFLQLQGGPALADFAAWGLQRRHPALSAAPADKWLWVSRLKRALSVLLFMVLAPVVTWGDGSMLPVLLFLSFVGVRLAASLCPPSPPPRPYRQPDHELPTYTVIAALYHEPESVASLVQAIEALDYPHEKLDVILVIEPDDLQTRAAIARLGPRPHLRVLIAPAVGPRTKPKALNYALPFARGSVVAVFDAEDRPAPDQLRAALAAFAGGGSDVGCVQASLCIDNLTHFWLSRIFAAEYAGNFDAVLPGFTRFGLPLALGGSSNHFRTEVLREVGAWDPYNVTEDADLGIRLARFGYRAISFDSVTYEEAPISFAAWLRQRSRWMKGWMQTCWVHLRRPRRLWREAGWRGVLALNLYVGGSVLTALVHPLLLAYLLIGLVELVAFDGSTISVDASFWLHGLAIAAGYVGTAAVALIGLARRGRLGESRGLLWMPVYWVYLSIAAWRALGQFVWTPYHWEKTEHGLAERPPWTAVRPSPQARGEPLRDSA